MPNVLMEAQATGLPVVASNVGGVSDCMIDGETGYLVDRDDIEGLRAGVLNSWKTITFERDSELTALHICEARSRATRWQSAIWKFYWTTQGRLWRS